VTATLFGLVAATSPCQLTTNVSALAYAAARPGGARPFPLALAYVAGKVSAYGAIGALVVLVGLELPSQAVPVVVVARKVLGPLMIAVGLGLLGVWRLSGSVGQRRALRLRERLTVGGPLGAFLLGVAFSFAFCPTLFLLFFGLTIPLAFKSTGGWIFPGLFAVGSSLPLILVTAGVAAGIGSVDRVTGALRVLDRPLRVTAAALLVIAGLHDSLVYWML
jgi:sulfite exporter TauE/SafE